MLWHALLTTLEWLCIEMLWHALLKTPEWLCIEVLCDAAVCLSRARCDAR